MAKREVIELLKKYITLLETEGIVVRKAYLYGSHSTGTEKEDSDIDLMIVIDNSDAQDDFVIGKIWKLTRKVDTKIEPYLIGTDRFDKSEDSPLINMIKTSGVKIAQTLSNKVSLNILNRNIKYFINIYYAIY